MSKLLRTARSPIRSLATSAGFGRQQSRWKASTVVLGIIPIFTFGLGVWQIKRLQWKVKLIDELQDKLAREEMTLPRRINPEVIPEFEYRRVRCSGVLDHSKEILLGPNTREGSLGYHVITPLIRPDGAAPILVNRGFVAREKIDQSARPESLPSGTQEVTGLLRAQEPRNAFSTTNDPARNQWTFADINQMAEYTGTQPVLVDQVFAGTAGEAHYRLSKGIPVGRGTDIQLRNMHATYIATWFTLSAATAIMFVGLMRRSPNRTLRSEVLRRQELQ